LLDYEVVGKSILYRVTYYDKLPMGTWLAVTPFGVSTFTLRVLGILETWNTKLETLDPGQQRTSHRANRASPFTRVFLLLDLSL